MKTTILTILLAIAAGAATGPWDADVADFPRQAGETGDSARILRAVHEAGKGGVVWFPKGEYEIDAMLVVSNQCSLWLHKSAHLKAVREMPYVLKYFGRQLENSGEVGGRADHNLFIRGGDIDGNGLASCAHVMGLRHFTLADTTYRNGRKVGLQLGDPSLPRSIEGGYEVVANNLYFICNLPGLAGNVGFWTNIGDAHFTDLVVVDHTVGIRDTKWSNRFTRCHIWGGIVKKAGTDEPEYLPDSVAFDLRGTDAVLTDCYADTAMTGFRVARDARVFNCGYYNNWRFRMDNPTVFAHEGGTLIVTGGRFSKNSPHATLYRRGEKAGRITWRDNLPLNFTAEEMAGLNAELGKRGESEKSSVSNAKLAGPSLEVADYAITPKPTSPIVTFSSGAMSRGFSWQTDVSVKESVVQLVPQTSNLKPQTFSFTGTCTVVSSPTTHCHRVMIDRLEPGAYAYRIGEGDRGVRGRLTVRKPGEKVTIVNFNDAQTSNPKRLNLFENTLAASAKAIGGADKADFLINGGDFADGWLRRYESEPKDPATGKPIKREYMGRSVEWGVMGDTLASFYGGVPMLSSSGNHDFNDYGSRMAIRYPEGLFPGCESLDYGSVHVVAVPFAAGVWHERYEKIYAWLEKDLAANQAKGRCDWTIVCAHWGPYTTGDHGVHPATTNFVVRLGALCAKYRVDLVLQAHDHTFSKTLPYRWSGKGWTTNETDSAAVNLSPRQKTLDGETWDLDPEGTYYLSAGCAGHRVGENAAYAAATGEKSYRNREMKIVTGKIGVDSKWAKAGDNASSDLPRQMFGVIRIDGRRLAYDWYVVDKDGTFELYDKLRVSKD